MNLHTSGAEKRPKLSLAFGGRPTKEEVHNGHTIAELKGMELRRLVAEMVD